MFRFHLLEVAMKASRVLTGMTLGVAILLFAGCNLLLPPTSTTTTTTTTTTINPHIAEVAAAKAVLAITYASGETAAGVKSNVILPTSQDSVSVSWESSDAGTVATNGTVTRPKIWDVGLGSSITLTATLTKGTVTDTKVFDMTVKPQAPVALSKAQMDEATSWRGAGFGVDKYSNIVGQIWNDSASAHIDTTGNGGLAFSFRMKYESAGNNGDFIFLVQKKANANDPSDSLSNYWDAANQTHGIAFTQSWESPQGAGKGRVVGMGYGKNPLSDASGQVWGDSVTNSWTDGAFHEVIIVKSPRNASNEVVFTVYVDGVQYWRQTEAGVPDYSAGSYIPGYNVYNATVTFENPAAF